LIFSVAFEVLVLTVKNMNSFPALSGICLHQLYVPDIKVTGIH